MAINTSGSTNEYTYQLLGRLKADCEYFLGAGSGSSNHLWAGDTEGQLSKMRDLYNSLPSDAKPQWLTESDISAYEKAMIGGCTELSDVRVN